jgi:hypothetical protein
MQKRRKYIDESSHEMMHSAMYHRNEKTQYDNHYSPHHHIIAPVPSRRKIVFIYF